MNFIKVVKTICIISLLFCISCSSASVENKVPQTDKTKPDPVDSILEKLNKKTQDLKTYQCQIEYNYEQPSVFGTQTIRKGALYYSKQDDTPVLRVNFDTLIQDEEQQKSKLQYIIAESSSLPDIGRKLEGFWLVQLDYEFENAMFKQITQAYEPNQVMDVFDLISRHLPMVGFTRADELKEQFEITIDEKKDESENFIQVNLKVKPNSVYKNEYVFINFRINEKLNLPERIVAFSTEPSGEPLEQKDFHEIKLLDAKTNEKIEKDIFNFEIPDGFEVETFPLNNNDGI